MKKIIIPTDFSAAATNATNYAVDMAIAIQAEVILFHVLYIPITYTEVPPAVTPENMEKEMKDKLDELKQKLLHKCGHAIKIETEVRIGTIMSELTQLCKEQNPYAIVMGSQGASATEYTLFGSHSSNVMRHLKWPVIAVPSGVKFNAIKKIALACDFENVAEKIPVDEVEKMVKDFHSQLFVINTDKTKYHNPDKIFESGLLQVMLQDLNPNYQFITHHDIDEGIMDFCEKNNIDLLIVFPKRHTLIDKMIRQSHTKKLVLQSHVPVMAIHE